MKIQDLRIGNYVNFKDRQDIDYCIVNDLYFPSGIHILRNFKDGDGDDQPEVIDDITGIPLTEAWIKRLGFQDIFDSIFCKSTNKINFDVVHSLLDRNKPETLGWYLCVEERPVYNKIEFVHDLQNIYLSLTEEELQVK